MDVYDLVPDQPEQPARVEVPALPEERDDFGWDDHDPICSRAGPAAPPRPPTGRSHPWCRHAVALPERQPWYRTKQAAAVLAAAVTVAVVSGGWLLFGGPTTAVEKSSIEAPTSAPPAPSKVAPTAVNAASRNRLPRHRRLHPHRPSRPIRVRNGSIRSRGTARRTEQEKPGVGVTRTPATRAPMSVAPVPRPVEGSDSNTPGDAPGEKPRRRGCFGFC